MAIEMIHRNLSGATIIDRLRKGHIVRRACWVNDFYIRICNEDGFDENGNAKIEGKFAIYTHATNGYFLHIGYSSQPFRKPEVHRSGYGKYRGDPQYWDTSGREGEGIAMLFADDWEDHGFKEAEDFEILCMQLKERVKINERLAREDAVREAGLKELIGE